MNVCINIIKTRRLLVMDYGVSKRMKEARLKANISLKELGESIGISESNMQKHESGNVKGIDYVRIKKIAEALKVTSEWLLGWEKKKAIKTIDVTDLSDESISKVKEYIELLKK
jgi:transcriptional regulator with XRE-family HTH domain